MFKLYRLPHLVTHCYVRLSKTVRLEWVKNIHISSANNVKTRNQVSEYLLNRNIPASEILNSLEEKDAKELENIKVQYQFMLSNGGSAPKLVEDKDYLELLCLSYYQRQKYFHFLAKREFARESEITRKANKKKLMESKVEDANEVHIPNRLHSKYISKADKALVNNRLFQAIVLKSQEVVFDFSFEDEMYRKDVKNMAKQIQFCYAINRDNLDPFQMVLANVESGSITHCDLSSFLLSSEPDAPVKRIEDLPMLVSERHYLDLFPGRRLVYLSPDSGRPFEQGEYDHDAVLIVGALVQTDASAPLTLSRARSEGLEHRALPIDRAVHWRSGHKDLTLNQVFQALSIARDTDGDWDRAVSLSVPPRALIDQATLHRGRRRRRRQS